MVTKDQLIEKIMELSSALKIHPVYKDFTETSQQMRENPVSQGLLEQLVYMGRELDEKVSRGEEPNLAQNEGYHELKSRLDNDPLVKRYIETQKAYIAVLQAVMERIYKPL